jgi:hypothetical protein
MSWSNRYCAVSIRQIYFKMFLSTGHCMMSYRPRHEITMFSRQKYIEQCLSDQIMKKKCPTDKFSYILLQYLSYLDPRYA